jgi:hypothetical protein
MITDQNVVRTKCADSTCSTIGSLPKMRFSPFRGSTHTAPTALLRVSDPAAAHRLARKTYIHTLFGTTENAKNSIARSLFYSNNRQMHQYIHPPK